MSDDTPTERFNTNDDDAPTKKFPVQPEAQQPADGSRMPPAAAPRSAFDDAPTEFIGAAIPPRAAQSSRLGSNVPPTTPGSPAPGTPGDAEAAKKRRRTITIWLIVAGVVLVAVIAVLASVLLTRGSTPIAAPTSSSSPSASAPAAPSQEPEPSETATTEPAPPEPTPTSPPPVQGAAFTSFTPADNSPVVCPDEFSTAPLTFSWSSTGAALAWIGVDTDNAKANPHAEVDTTATYRDLGFDCSKETQLFTVTLDDGTGRLTSQSVTLVRQLR